MTDKHANHAPELLSTLETVTAQLKDMAQYLEGCREEPETEANAAIAIAEAVIAKAQGGGS